ncbi:hypothetical protein MLD38_029030 [Melastoma candidum]|uniref:Uncharacterized protein n=1 Tax=Melastoma candidum TaxID=119954 RepID=A0ACB9N2H3_9MYRT|nr:hypothetical protein MLD38_029030 [Melastoma candidum]
MEGHDAHGNPRNRDNEGDDNRSEGDISEAEVVVQDDDEQQNKRKYKRHTQFQIEQLESLFHRHPHPSKQQMLELANRVGLEAKQVKFWFQNRRTQEKVKDEHLMIRQLRKDNDRLNHLINSGLVSSTCSDHGCPPFSSFSVPEHSNKEQQMKAESVNLKDATDYLVAVARSLGKLTSSSAFPSSSCISISEVDLSGKQRNVDTPTIVGKTLHMGPVPGDCKPVTSFAPSVGTLTGLCSSTRYPKKVDIFEAAVSAMDVVIKLATQPGEPLWSWSISGEEVLNYEEYAKVFDGAGMARSGAVAEASRHTAVVPMDSFTIVETLMDVKKWIGAFPSIVANASIVDTISSSPGTRNGTLQLMNAECQVLSPSVSIRRVRFLRLCWQHEGFWSIIDASFEDNWHAAVSSNCRKLPSGCILQDLPNGCCKVTWIEHLEHNGAGIHPLFRDVLTSGVAFGARRWVASLQRHCEFLALVMRPSRCGARISGLNDLGKRNIIKLAQRMTDLFYSGICSSSRRRWETLHSGNNCVRLMLRRNIGGPLEPAGMLLSATASIRFPVKQEILFNFLSDHHNRNEWDTLSNGRSMQEILNIAKAPGHKNHVSILQANGVDSGQASMVLLQEAWTNACGSLIVYAPVDSLAINDMMMGGDLGTPTLLPYGFAIYPFGSSSSPTGTSGCFLTIGFQVLLSTRSDTQLIPKLVEASHGLIYWTTCKLKAAMRLP